MWVKRRGAGVVVDFPAGFAGAAVGVAVGMVAVIVGAAVGPVVGCFCLLLVGAAAVGAAGDGAGVIGVGAVAGGPLSCCILLQFLLVARLNLSDEKVTLSPPIGNDGAGVGACDVASGTL